MLAALSGNNSVKILHPRCVDEADMHSLLQALQGNKGIEDLTMEIEYLSVINWCRFLHILSTHPRIECVTFDGNLDCISSLSVQSKTTWMNAMLQMLQRNTAVHTLDLPIGFDNEDVYQRSILPRLEMNRNYFQVQRKAVKRADPSIRPPTTRTGIARGSMQPESSLSVSFGQRPGVCPNGRGRGEAPYHSFAD
jgi:hypothetical protein